MLSGRLIGKTASGHRASSAMRSKVVVLGLLALLCSGCLGISSEATREDSVASDASSSVGTPSRKDAAIKPTKPDPEDAAGSALHETKKTATSNTKGGNGPEIWLVKHRSSSTNAAIESEREQARAVAGDLAKRLRSVRTIRLCYDNKEKEWWISLYEDSGGFFEVRQFIWSPLKDKPEPFLVQERITRARLEAHLTAARKDFTCQVLERSGEKSPAPAAEANKSTPEKTKAKSPGTKIAGEAPTRKPTPKRVEVAIPPRVTNPAPVGASAAKKADPPKTPSKPQPATKAAPAEPEEKVYRLASAGPVQREVTQKNLPRAAMSVQPDYRPAVAGEMKREVPAKSSLPKDRSDQASDAAPLKPLRTPAGQAVAALPPQETKLDVRSSRPTYSIFVYGSEMNHSELMAWLEANRYDTALLADAAPGVLEGYDFVWNYFSPSRHGGAVNLEPRPGSKIWGLLIEVEDKLLDAFDRKAGHPNYYSRGEERIPVKRIQDGRTVFAWLYVAKPNKGARRDIWPTRDYKSRVLEAAMFWDFPEEYIRKIRDWPTR